MTTKTRITLTDNDGLYFSFYQNSLEKVKSIHLATCFGSVEDAQRRIEQLDELGIFAEVTIEQVKSLF